MDIGLDAEPGTSKAVASSIGEKLQYASYFVQAAVEFETGKGDYKGWWADVRSCVGGVGWSAMVDSVNPLQEDAKGIAFDSAPDMANVASAYFFNQALRHAINRGLTTPFRSSIFRRFLSRSAFASEVEDAAPLAAGDYTLGVGVIAEVKGCL